MSVERHDTILAIETYSYEIQKVLKKIKAVLPNLHFSDGEDIWNS